MEVPVRHLRASEDREDHEVEHLVSARSPSPRRRKDTLGQFMCASSVGCVQGHDNGVSMLFIYKTTGGNRRLYNHDIVQHVVL